jgi:hypothetical protein
VNTGTERSPLAPHSASPSELRERLEAERRGTPFLVFRADGGAQRIVVLDDQAGRLTIGRRSANDIALTWDPEVSGLHAAMERLGAEWTLLDDGLSKNGSFVNGVRVTGRRVLRDGDLLRFGDTVVAYCAAGRSATTHPTAGPQDQVHVSPPTEAQRRVLVALCRPFRDSTFAQPATNREIAEELVVSVDAVKAHLHALYERFGIDHLPQNEKRARLAWEALQANVITPRELWSEAER